jgi:beta-phosphoglucomutase family hydrolase
LKLPSAIRACLFDLDGVLTDTASLHAAAWKEMFDTFLRSRAADEGAQFVPFDPVRDYREFIDGKQRSDGVRSFLASRGIALPEGSPGDPADALTVSSLGDRKNELLLAMIHERGVQAYDGSVRFVQAVRDAGLRRAVVSASANCREVLEAAGIADLFEVRVDGNVAQQEHLRGKPAPDMFLAAARMLGVAPGEAAVFEDALAGVAAGRAGGFGLVVGVDRVGQADALRAHGADIVVTDLAELLSPA